MDGSSSVTPSVSATEYHFSVYAVSAALQYCVIALFYGEVLSSYHISDCSELTWVG